MKNVPLRNQKPVIVINILQQIRNIPVPQYSYITEYNLRLLVAGKCIYKILHLATTQIE